MKSDNQGVKETFIQTSRRGRDRQLGQRGHAARQWLANQGRWQLADWVVSHLCVNKLGGKNGEWDTLQPRVPVWGKKASKPLTEKTCEGCGSRRNSQPYRRVCWRDPQGPRTYTNPRTQESAPEGPICLWVAEEVNESSGESGKRHWSLSDTSPTYSPTTQWRGLSPPYRQISKATPLTT